MSKAKEFMSIKGKVGRQDLSSRSLQGAVC
jgi:hypothetical protein